MIKKQYVISSSIKMSNNYTESNKGVGLTPITFKNFVKELYKHPVFILVNESEFKEEYFVQDTKLYSIINKLGESNYFYGSKEFRGSRKLILNALDEIRNSIVHSDIDKMKLPDTKKQESLISLYKEFYSADSFDYSKVVKEVIDRIEKGLYKEIFKGIEVVVLDELNLIGYENRLFELIEVITTTKDNDVNLDNIKDIFCTSSITPEGSINNLLSWMEENSLNSNNTVIVPLDYDYYVPLFYQMREDVPVSLTKGLKYKDLDFFTGFMTQLYDKSILYKENETFLEKVKNWVLKLSQKSETTVEKTFYNKVAIVTQSLKGCLHSYADCGLDIDSYQLLYTEIVSLSVSNSELEQNGSGFTIASLDDLYALNMENIVVLGLNHKNYPRKETIDPILKSYERESINKSLNACLNLGKSTTDKRLEKLITNSTGKILLSYESHDSSTGKLELPSQFFNNILKLQGLDLKLDNVYKLCNVKESLIEEYSSIKNIKSNENNEYVAKSINQVYENIYSNEVTELDYGIHSNFNKKLSASKLETFYKCPYSFHLKYNLYLEEPDLSTVDLSSWLGPMERGTFLHRMYEESLKPFIGSEENYQSFLSSIDEERIEEIFQIALDEKVNNDSNVTFRNYNKEVPEYIIESECNELKKNLNKFINTEINRVTEFYPVHLELEFEYDITIDGEDLKFKGFIDRVDTDGYGKYLILDYKTGKNSFIGKEEYLFLVETKYAPRFYFQHAIYSKALNEIKGITPDKIAAGYYFSTDKGNWSIVTHIGDEPQTKLQELLKCYLEEVKVGKYYKNPGNCTFCTYKSICRNVQKQRKHVEIPQLLKLVECAGANNA